MMGQQGMVMAVMVIALGAIAYYSISGGAGDKKPAPPAAPEAPAAAMTLAVRGTRKPQQAGYAPNAAGLTTSERARIRMDGGLDVHGEGVAVMNKDQLQRAKESTAVWTGLDDAEAGSDFKHQIGEIGSAHEHRIKKSLPRGVSESHKNYVRELRRTKGGQGRVNLSGARGAEFTQNPTNFKGIWTQIVGRKPVEHGMNHAQIDSVAHCHEDGFARRLGRPQYQDKSRSCGQETHDALVKSGVLGKHRAGGIMSRASLAGHV
jgi:hypothetical protein